jgi:hypothetical protein
MGEAGGSALSMGTRLFRGFCAVERVGGTFRRIGISSILSLENSVR